jgi:hypothetical protein
MAGDSHDDWSNIGVSDKRGDAQDILTIEVDKTETAIATVIADDIGCGNGSTWWQSDHDTDRHDGWQDGQEHRPHGYAGTQHMIGLSEGNLHTAIDHADRRDEIGELSKALDIFRQHMIGNGKLQAERQQSHGAGHARAARIGGTSVPHVADFECAMKTNWRKRRT